MRVFEVVVTAASLGLAGCAIQPSVEDTTGLTPYHITAQIRCESRQALRDEILRWLTRNPSPKLQAIGEKLQTDPDAFAAFGPATFADPTLVHQKEIVSVFMNAGVAYDFELGMSENDDLTAGASFIKPLTNPVTTLGLGGTFKRTRTSTVAYTNTDTFSSLLKLPANYCSRFVVTENRVYPIAGRIGMDKAIADFVEMTLFTGMIEKGKTSGPPTMTRALSFRTEIGISAEPLVTYTPLDAAFQTKSLTLNAAAGRVDTHKVTVGLAIPSKSAAAVESLRGNILSEGAGRLVVTRTVIGGGTSAEQLAVLAIDRFKSREVKLVPSQ